MQWLKSWFFGTVVGLVVLLVVFFLVFVSPLLSQKSEEKKNVASSITKAKIISCNLYSQNDVQNLDNCKKEIATQFSDIISYYRGYDDILEQWFEGKLVSPKEFVGIYKKEKDQLEKKLEEIGCLKSENVFNWEDFKWEDFPAENWSKDEKVSRAEKDIQKKCYIRRRILEAISKGIPKENIKSTELYEIKMGRVYSNKFGDIKDLPNPLGKAIPFGIHIKIYYGDFANFLMKLLDQDDRDVSPKLLVLLRGIYIIPTDYLELEIPATKEEKKEEILKKYLRPVEVWLVCDVLDSDEEMVRKK